MKLPTKHDTPVHT